MEVRSTFKFARISPLKARDVAREIQGLPVSQAIDILTFTPRKAAHFINKTLKSAVANAENNHDDVNVDSLVVKEATVGKGPAFRRYKPRARGSASPIRKPTSHIFIVLTDEIELPEPKQKSGGKKKSKKAKKKPAAKAEVKPEVIDEVVEAAAAPVEEATAPVEEAAAVAEVVETTDAVAAPEEAGTGSGDPSSSRLDERLGVLYDGAPSEIDDLKKIGGVGPVLEEKLHSQGVYTFAQVANWNEENIAAFDELLDFKDRISRDEWTIQARAFHLEKYGREP